jgi:DNA replication protein DnaC
VRGLGEILGALQLREVEDQVDPGPPRLDVLERSGRMAAEVRGHCATCRGCGHVFEADAVGRTCAAPCPDCYRLRHAAESLTAAGLPGGPFLGVRLATTDWARAAVRPVRSVVEDYVQKWDKGRGSLAFCGPNQRGKTHLLVAMARHVALHGHVVRWARVPQLLEMTRVECTAARRFLRSERVDLLVLDELGGADPGHDWVRGIYEELVGHRLEHGRPCLLSTNLRPEAGHGEALSLVDVVGERVTARLRRHARVIVLGGEEYRP